MLGKDESGGREGRGFEPTSRLFSAERRVWFGGGGGCRLPSGDSASPQGRGRDRNRKRQDSETLNGNFGNLSKAAGDGAIVLKKTQLC